MLYTYLYISGGLFLYALIAMVIYHRHLMRGPRRTKGLHDVTDRQYLFFCSIWILAFPVKYFIVKSIKEPDHIPDCRTYTSREIRQQIRFFEKREIEYEDNEAHHYLMRYDQFFKERLPPDADDEKLRMRIWMFLNAQRLRH